MNSSEHEEVMVFSDEASGLHAILTIHDTSLGPARGGTRMRPYKSPMEALDDALALSLAMSLKLAFYGLPHGGGKAVIIDDAAGADPAVRRRRLKAFARSLRRHAERFSTGPDLGTDAADMAVIRETAPNVIGDDPAVLRRISRATVLSVLAVVSVPAVRTSLATRKYFSEASLLLEDRLGLTVRCLRRNWFASALAFNAFPRAPIRFKTRRLRPAAPCLTTTLLKRRSKAAMSRNFASNKGAESTVTREGLGRFRLEGKSTESIRARFCEFRA